MSAVLAFLVRRRWPVFALTFGAAVALAAALGVWGALVYPVNQRWAELPPGALPPDWQVLRARWEYGHVAHAVLLALGFAALVTSVLVDTVPWRASGRRRQGRREARRVGRSAALLAALDESDDGGETGLHEA